MMQLGGKLTRPALFFLLISCVSSLPWAADPIPAESGGVLPFTGYNNAPSFTVKPLKKKLRNCERCHSEIQHNTTIRVLVDAPHIDVLNHGKGRFWCLECHDVAESNKLHTPTGEKINFSESYLICGSCHANRQKDWYFGAHGKRSENWDGQRIIWGCTNCHDPHEPALQPYKPKPPPQFRIGLEATKIKQHNPAATIWPWQIVGGAHE